MAAAVIAALLLGGCSDFSQHRFGGVRNLPDDAAQRPPEPGPALSIPNAPSVAHADFAKTSDTVKQAKFIPKTASEPPRLQVDPKLNPALTQDKNPLRAIYEHAKARYAGMDSYIFRLKRREVVKGRRQPEEILQVKLRRAPYSVYLKWLNPECKGREVVFVHGKYDNKMEIRLAPQDPFALLMSRARIAPDDPMARGKSRYPITETGFGPLIDRFGKMVAAVEKGDKREGTVKYLGRVKRPEFPGEVEAVQQSLPPGSDPGLGKGGQRWWFFDASTGLPALVIAHDASGEVEYYCHDHIQSVRLDDDDFNPDRLWQK